MSGELKQTREHWAIASATLGLYQYGADYQQWLDDDKPLTASAAQALLAAQGYWDGSDTLQAIQALHEKGARYGYQQLVDILYGENANPTKFTEAHPHLVNEIAVIQQLQGAYDGDGTDPCSLLGYDLGRYIALNLIAISAGYLNADSTWENAIIPAAKRLQTTFSDWLHLARNQLFGEKYDNADNYDTRKEQTKVMQTTVWTALPWNLDQDDASALDLSTPPPVETTVTADVESVPENSVAKPWALAANAIIFMSKKQPFDTLEDNREKAEALARDYLESWNIDSKEDWQHQYNWLIHKGGHRASFSHIAGVIAHFSEAEYAKFLSLNETLKSEIEAVKTYYTAEAGEKPGIAWDLCRAIGMTRWSYQAGYIDEAEAWEHIMPVARRLQATFSSFIELGKAFLAGQACWIPDADREEFRKIMLDLEYDRFLAWHTIPWDTSLGSDDDDIAPADYRHYRYYGNLRHITTDHWQEGNTTPQTWALACNGILFGVHENPLGGLDDHPHAPFPEQNYQDVLEDSWGIGDKDNLLKQLTSLSADGGHRKGFKKLADKIDNCVTEEDLEALIEKNPDWKKEIKIVKNSYKSLGENGILAWDYCRYIALCRWGYLAGYIDANEAWEYILPVARMLQQRFKSWDDIGENYMLGREYWDPDMSEDTFNEFMGEFNRLKYQPQSYWLQLPFDLDLGEGDVHDPDAKPKREVEAFNPMA